MYLVHIAAHSSGKTIQEMITKKRKAKASSEKRGQVWGAGCDCQGIHKAFVMLVKFFHTAVFLAVTRDAYSHNPLQTVDVMLQLLKIRVLCITVK